MAGSKREQLTAEWVDELISIATLTPSVETFAVEWTHRHWSTRNDVLRVVHTQYCQHVINSSIDQSINTFITRHGTEARATVRIMPKRPLLYCEVYFVFFDFFSFTVFDLQCFILLYNICVFHLFNKEISNKEKCLKPDLKCINRWSSATVQRKRVPESWSSNRETTSSSVHVSVMKRLFYICCAPNVCQFYHMVLRFVQWKKSDLN